MGGRVKERDIGNICIWWDGMMRLSRHGTRGKDMQYLDALLSFFPPRKPGNWPKEQVYLVSLCHSSLVCLFTWFP